MDAMQCADHLKKLKSEFRALIDMEIDSDSPAEHRMSEHGFVTDWGVMQDVASEAFEHHAKELSQCGMTRDFALDILEGEWQKLMANKAWLNKFSREIEKL